MIWGKPINYGWQLWFAWRPIRLTTGQWVWLEWVERAYWFLNRTPEVDPYKNVGPMGLTYVYRLPAGASDDQ